MIIGTCRSVYLRGGSKSKVSGGAFFAPSAELQSQAKYAIYQRRNSNPYSLLAVPLGDSGREAAVTLKE